MVRVNRLAGGLWRGISRRRACDGVPVSVGASVPPAGSLVASVTMLGCQVRVKCWGESGLWLRMCAGVGGGGPGRRRRWRQCLQLVF